MRCRFKAGEVTAIIGAERLWQEHVVAICCAGFCSRASGGVRFVEATSGVDGPPPPMATVWQNFNLFPWRTVLDNVAFGLEAAGMAKDGAARTARVARSPPSTSPASS